MASTLDYTIKNIQAELEFNTANAVQQSVTSLLGGKTVVKSTISSSTNSIINRAMGGIVNDSIRMVNRTIAESLGRKYKNSSLNAITSNYAASVIQSVIVGQQVPGMSYRLSSSISQAITVDLLQRLPTSLTKNVRADVMGNTVRVNIDNYVSSAISQTVGAVIQSVITNAITSTATSTKVSGLSSGLNIFDQTEPDLTSYAIDNKNINSGIIDSISGLASSVGSAISNVTDSILSLGSNLSSSVSEISLPDGLDVSRFSSGGSQLGKLIELSSLPMGTITNISGLDRSDFEVIQNQLATSNVNNQYIDLGGTFSNIDSPILGNSTTSGKRSITKDLTTKFTDINQSFDVFTAQEEAAFTQCQSTTLQMSKVIADEAVTSAKSFDPLSVDQLEKLVNIKEGFKDPNAKYPLPDYKNITETNKLATGNVTDTIVEKKNADRMIGAQLPNGESWSQPVSPYNAKYPYNHVQETESGHIIEVDDTPNAERLHLYHKSGTFVEVDAVGNKTSVIKGSDYTIIDKNGYISIQGKANVSVTGSVNVFIGANANIEVSGNTNVTCHNNIELNAAGRLKLTGGEGVDIVSPEIYLDASNQLQINSDVNTKIHTKEMNIVVDTDMKADIHNDLRITTDGDTDIKVKKSTKLYSTEDIHIKTDTNIFESVASDKHVNVTGNIFNQTSGEYNIKATGNINGDGSQIWLNSGKSNGASNAQTAVDAKALETEYCDTHYIEGRKSIVENVISEQSTKEINSNKVSEILRIPVTNTSDITDTLKSQLIIENNVDLNVIERKPITLEEATKTANINLISTIIPSELPLNDTVLPGNLNLSPYFTINALTTETNHPSVLQPVGDMMPLNKVIANLQYLALNVLEPIYAIRPDMIIDTAFVPNNGSTLYDRNNYGLSISLDFKKASSFEDYFDIVKNIQNVIAFDELILHYLSKDFVNSHNDTAVIIINVSGVYYPTVNQNSDATILQSWMSSNNKMILKTWYNTQYLGEGLKLVS